LFSLWYLYQRVYIYLQRVFVLTLGGYTQMGVSFRVGIYIGMVCDSR
jgi:hypothetical protein